MRKSWTRPARVRPARVCVDCILWCCGALAEHTCCVALRRPVTGAVLVWHDSFPLCKRFCAFATTTVRCWLQCWVGSLLCTLSGCTLLRRRCAAAAAGADRQRGPGSARGAAAARGGRGGCARAPAHVRHCPGAGHGAAAIDAGALPFEGRPCCACM